MNGSPMARWLVAAIGLLLVLALGVASGVAVLPLAARHHQEGAIPGGMALRINLGSGVQARVGTTQTLGGSPRYEYTVTTVAQPDRSPLEGRILTGDCEVPVWVSALGQSCSGDLLVVVDPGRPIRLYYGKDGIEPDIDPDVFVEESHRQ